MQVEVAVLGEKTKILPAEEQLTLATAPVKVALPQEKELGPGGTSTDDGSRQH